VCYNGAMKGGLLCLALVVAPILVGCQAGPPPGGDRRQPLRADRQPFVTFEERFASESEAAARWQRRTPCWRSESCRLVAAGGERFLRLRGLSSPSDDESPFPTSITTARFFFTDHYRIELRLRLVHGGLDLKLRHNPDHGSYVLRLERSGVTLYRHSPAGKDEMRIALRAAVSVAAGRWHTIAVDGAGSKLAVELDRKGLGAFVDPRPLGPGRLELSTTGADSEVHVADLRVIDRTPRDDSRYRGEHTVVVDARRRHPRGRTAHRCATLWTLDGASLPYSATGPTARRLREARLELARIRAIGDEGWLGGGVVVSRGANRELKLDFRNLDETVARLAKMGLEPYMRLGWEMPHAMADPRCARGSAAYWTCPPADYAEWETLVERVVRRYNVDQRRRIRYWVVWNEPNIAEFGGDARRGLRKVDNYLRLYEASVRGALRADPTIKIGGPGTAESCSDGPVFGESCFWWYGAESSAKLFVDGLLALAASKRARLDLLVFHKYGLAHPRYHVQLIDEMRALARARGLAPELVLDEWTLWGDRQDERSAAYIAASVQYHERARLDLSCYTAFSGLGAESRPASAFPESHQLAIIDGRVIHTPYHAFLALARLGDQALEATVDGKAGIAPDDALGVIATTGRGAIQLLVWRFDDQPKARKLAHVELRHLGALFPGSTRCRVQGYLIDRTHNNPDVDYLERKRDTGRGRYNLESASLERQLAEERRIEGGRLPLTLPLDGYSVWLVTVEPAAGVSADHSQ